MTIKVQQRFNTGSALLLSTCIVLLTGELAQAKSKYVCDEPQPETMCNAANTCGSASSPCTIDIGRSASSANVKTRIHSAKNNQFFRHKTGTMVAALSSDNTHGCYV